MIQTPMNYRSMATNFSSDGMATTTTGTSDASNATTTTTTTTTTNVMSPGQANQTLMLAVLVLVGTILLILVLFIAIFAGRKLSRHFRRIQCHVCLEKVDKKVWETSHRAECQKQNTDFLKTLPEPFDIRCPHCLAYLKLMPKVALQ